ncbi:hypothetical protein A3Q56_01350 [Intoshia linei]|uniref:Uncharacterized protein n=1 Tax=Intoshia linei TaxID=1819745 RepID=A0A177B9A9_9BILA|nr:hypothetical protein A3Q56_01350 [Intoshia linei]
MDKPPILFNDEGEVNINPGTWIRLFEDYIEFNYDNISDRKKNEKSEVIPFVLDTGSPLNIINIIHVYSLEVSNQIKPTLNELKSVQNLKIKIFGIIYLKINGSLKKSKFFVSRNTKNLLGCCDSVELENIVVKYEQVFTDTPGCFLGNEKISKTLKIKHTFIIKFMSQFKRSRLNTGEKKEIAVESKDKNYGPHKIATKFNSTLNQARGIIKNSNKLLSLNDIHISSDYYLKTKIEHLRNFNCKISFSIIHTLIENYNLKNNITIPKTNYFVRKFIKRANIEYVTLHGESADADLSQIDKFKLQFKNISKAYGRNDVFNVDEADLYIKGTGNKSYVIDKLNDKKDVKSTSSM